MNDFLSGTEDLFSLLLRAAWCAGILLAFVWLIDRAGRKWLSPRVRYALWLLVAARLVMLWTPGSSLSLVGRVEDAARFVSSLPRAGASEPLDLTPPQVESDLPYSQIEPMLALEAMEWESELASAPAPVKVFWSDWTVWTLVAMAWGFGALLFAVKLFVDFWRLRTAMRKMEVVESGEVENLLRRVEKDVLCSSSWFALRTAGQASSGTPVVSAKSHMALGVPNAMPPRVKPRLRLLVCERLASPAVTGVFRPALLLPRIFLDQLTLSELEHVFRHELTHVKRRDVLVNWVLAWVGAVYWFFPLMRYLLSQLRKTRELACDAAVLARASAAERAAYGKTLVRVLEMAAVGDRPVLTFTVGVAGMVWPMGNSRRESRMMKERLELVVCSRSAGKLAVAMAVIVLGLLTVVGFTEGQEKTTDAKGEVVAAAFVARDIAYGSDYRWIEQSYDFTETRKLFEKDPLFFKMPAITTIAPSPGAPPVKLDPVVSARGVMREWVERVVKESGWTDRMAPTIRWHDDDQAFISHSYKSHERLARALKALHTTPESQYAFEFSVGTMDADEFGKIDVKDFRIATSDLTDVSAELAAPRSASASLHSEETISRRVPIQRIFLNDDQKKRLIAELEGIRSFHRLSAPKVTTLNTQSASVTIGEERPFVTGLIRTESGEEKPRYESVFCGLDVEQQAIALGDAKIWLKLKYRQTEVLGVVEEDAPGTGLKIQSPEIRLMSQSAGLEMKLGETLAIFSKSSGREGKKDQVLAMFVTVREVYLPPMPAPIGPDGAPMKAAVVEPKQFTRVFDVSQTTTLWWFDLQMKNDEQLRPMLIAPALDQLARLIEQTIDPESPKTIKRSTENLTLEVTASQEVLEKVGDLIKQLVRVAEKGNSGMLVAYDVSSLPCFGGIDAARATREELTKDQIADAFGKVFRLVDRKARESGDKTVEVQPFLINPALTVYVAATAKDQEKVAELLKQLKAMPVSEFEKALQVNELSEPQKVATTGSKQITRVFDVSRTPMLRGFNARSKDNEWLREKFIVPALEQLVLLIQETIDPESPKTITRSAENLTLEVTATQAVHEKVADLILALERISEDPADNPKHPANRLAPHPDSSPDDQAIYKALEQRIEVKFTDKPLNEVLKLLAETTNINIVPDNDAFVEEGITVNEPVSLDLRQPVSMRSALRLILDPMNLGFMVKNEALLITSKRLTHGKRTTVAYDVTGLKLFKEFMPDLQNKKELDESGVKAAFERLQAVIKDLIPAFKAEKDPAEIQPFYTNLTLVISATVEDQEKVAKLLKVLESRSLDDVLKMTNSKAVNQKANGASESQEKVYDLSQLPIILDLESRLPANADSAAAKKESLRKSSVVLQRIAWTIAHKSGRGSRMELQPISNHELRIKASAEDQQEAAKVLAALKKMSPEEAHQFIESTKPASAGAKAAAVESTGGERAFLPVVYDVSRMTVEELRRTQIDHSKVLQSSDRLEHQKRQRLAEESAPNPK